MDRRGTERVERSGGEGEGNVAKRGQAVTEVGQNRDRISNATDNVSFFFPPFFFLLGSIWRCFLHTLGTLISVDVTIRKPGGHSHVRSKQDGVSKKKGSTQDNKQE